jgi:outer membrane protein TolC
LIYQNALESELCKRVAHAGQIAHAYQLKYEIGEANILEYNKAQVNLLNVTKDAEANEIERNTLLFELASLNGGIAINFSDSVFPLYTITPDFEQWYTQTAQRNPDLQWIKQEITVSQKQKQLNTAAGLPKFNAGYMSEKATGEQFQGITIGVSIPLWENKNSVKYAKAKTIAMQSIEADMKLQFYNEMKALYTKAVDLQNSLVDYRNTLFALSNTVLLQKALDKGEISLIEYFLELSAYYESMNKLLEMERDLSKILAKLSRYQ